MTLNSWPEIDWQGMNYKAMRTFIVRHEPRLTFEKKLDIKKIADKYGAEYAAEHYCLSLVNIDRVQSMFDKREAFW